jgi:hypothetical protein
MGILQGCRLHLPHAWWLSCIHTALGDLSCLLLQLNAPWLVNIVAVVLHDDSTSPRNRLRLTTIENATMNMGMDVTRLAKRRRLNVVDHGTAAAQTISPPPPFLTQSYLSTLGSHGPPQELGISYDGDAKPSHIANVVTTAGTANSNRKEKPGEDEQAQVCCYGMVSTTLIAQYCLLF